MEQARSIKELLETIVSYGNHFIKREGGADVREALDQIRRLGESILHPWPVPVSKEQMQQFVRILTNIINYIQAYLNTSDANRSNIQLANRLRDFISEFEHAKIAFFATGALNNNLRDSLSKELAEAQGHNEEIKKELNSLREVAKDVTNREAVKRQRTFYDGQARTFLWLGAISFVLFTCLSAWFMFRVRSYMDERTAMEDFAQQDASLFTHALQKEILAQGSVVATSVDRFDKSCPDCERSLFINTIIKAHVIRIVEISFMLFLIAVALRSLNSSLHNYTINMQRANSLRAALQLLDRSHTDEAKDAMMDKAASAIFAHQPTGFNTKPPANLVQSVLEFGKSKTEPE